MEAVLKVPSVKFDGILHMSQRDEHYIKEFKYNVHFHSVCVGTPVKDKEHKGNVLFPCLHTSIFLRITAEKKLKYYYTLHIASDTFWYASKVTFLRWTISVSRILTASAEHVYFEVVMLNFVTIYLSTF